MSRIRSGPALLVFAAICAMLFVALLILGRDSNNSQHHSHVLAVLDGLGQSETRMDRDVLQVLSGLLLHYDGLVTERRNLRQGLEQMQSFVASGTLPEAEWQAYAQGVGRKLAVLEELKGVAAFVRHEESYLPHAVALYAANPRSPPGLVVQIQQVLLRLQQSPLTGQESVRSALLELEQSDKGDVQAILRHLLVLGQQRQELQQRVRLYFAEPNDLRLRQLRDAYMLDYQIRQDGILWVMRALQVMTFVLFAALGWAILRLVSEHAKADQAHQELHAAVISLRDAFALFAPDHSLRICNHQFQSLAGEDDAAMTDSVFLSRLGQAGWRRPDGAMLPDSLSRSLPEEILYHSGQNAYWLLRQQKIDDGGLVLLLTDLTEQKRNEEKIRKLSAAVEQSPVAIVVTDRGGTIEYANPRFLQQTGYAEHEILGANPRILQSGQVEPETYRQMWQALSRGGSWRGELINRRRNGELFHENVLISPVRDGNGVITHYIGLKEDITQQKHNAEMLLDANAENERMLHAASHDLQEPARLVQIYCQLLQRQLAADLPLDVRHSLNQIRDGARQLTLLVQGMVDYSRCGRSGQAFLPVQLASAVDAAWQDVLDSCPGAELHVERQDLPTIMGDGVLLHILFRNILDNALKYAAPGRQASVLVSAVAGDGGWRMDLADNGIGIVPEYLPTIADPFSRLHSRASHPGAGLGLASCRRIAKAHGGRLWLESVPGQGTVVHVWLPDRGAA